jgi:antitoxin VapB
MALSIKTKEADRLARELSRLTGETMTEAVTKSLSERLNRVREAAKSKKGKSERMLAYAARMRKHYDLGPVTKAEWDEGWGERE